MSMGKRVIRMGDPTDHGGKVLASGAPQFVVGGIPIALVGDPVSCPRDGHHNCVIVEGEPLHTVGGKAVAYEGHKVSCGASLISTAPNFTRD
jgi:uncharacterized Zn-binding protein involved in type VI secretion